MSRSNQLAGLITATPTATLDTINEINTSLNNDANLSTTLTNSINAKAPIASPTFTGDAVFDTNTLKVDATNNRVGIGTASPDGLLHCMTNDTTHGINAAADNFIIEDTGAVGMTFASDADMTIAFSDNNANMSGRVFYDISERALSLWTGEAQRMTVLSDGNVGIGNTAPEVDLHIGSYQSGSGQTATLRLSEGNGSGASTGFDVKYVGSSDKLFFTSKDGSGNFADRMVITRDDGKVGIGTSSPDTFLLHLQKANTDTSISLGTETDNHLVIQNIDNTSTNTGRYAGIQFTINASSGGAGRAGIYATYEGDADADLHFWTKEYGNVADRMIIDQGGGIALNSTGYYHGASGGSVRLRGGSFETAINNACTSLKIYPASTSNRTAGRYNTGIGFMHLDPHDYASGYAGMQAWVGMRLIDTPGQERDALVFATNSSHSAGSYPTERMSIDYHGSLRKNFSGSFAEGVAFGPSTESGYTSNYSVAIASDDFMIRFADASWNIHGSIRANGDGVQYNDTSDYRLKENVTPLGNALERLNKLSPKRFTWKNYPDLGEQDGFIAHEVDEVVPQAVDGEKDRMRDNGDIWPQGLDMSKLVPLLTASIQELSTKVTALENA